MSNYDKYTSMSFDERYSLMLHFYNNSVMQFSSAISQSHSTVSLWRKYQKISPQGALKIEALKLVTDDGFRLTANWVRPDINNWNYYKKKYT